MSAEEEEFAVPLPVLSDSDSEDGAQDAAEDCVSGAAGAATEALLTALSHGDESVAPRVFDAQFWRDLGAEAGLHVLERSGGGAADDASAVSAGSGPVPAGSGRDSESLARALRQRGYLASHALGEASAPSHPIAQRPAAHTPRGPRAQDHPALPALRRGLRLLKVRGVAPAFIYVYDEAWEVLGACWDLLAPVIGQLNGGKGEAESDVVLEPSFFAYALARPEEAEAEAAAAAGREIVRHSYVGGNFGLPHRDHSSRDCFAAADERSGAESAAPTMVSVWASLTPVLPDSGCIHVVPAEFDPLLHEPDHPLHLRPFDQHSRRANFDLAAAVSLAPLPAGAALAWCGSLIHWGGVCSRYTDAEPRMCLTATLRLRSARRTELQALNALPELTRGALPLPLRERVRYAAANLLLYRWWYSLARGVLPPEIIAGSSAS